MSGLQNDEGPREAGLEGASGMERSRGADLPGYDNAGSRLSAARAAREHAGRLARRKPVHDRLVARTIRG